MNRISIIILTAIISIISVSASDSIPSASKTPLTWRISTEITPSWIPATHSFLKGYNYEEKRIDAGLSGDLRVDFRFNPLSDEGRLYPGLYQGIGVGGNTFFSNDLLGSPVSVYAFQGAPISRLSDKLWIGYEWQFGAAFGWKHHSENSFDNNAVVSTSATAHIGLSLNLNYSLSKRWNISLGLSARHYSNGNTSFPNAGLNTLGASVGIAYSINPPDETVATDARDMSDDADSRRWLYDIVAYGAWRKRAVDIGNPAESQVLPGKFAVVGLQFSPLRQLNRWVAVGPSLDLQWDQSAGLAPYWIEGTQGESIRFFRPPFDKGLSIGLSAHAELTMPIFSVNVGLGYDILNPKGNKAFYQSLTLKTFVTRNIFINTGYRLGNFKTSQNLMLGIGVRL